MKSTSTMTKALSIVLLGLLSMSTALLAADTQDADSEVPAPGLGTKSVTVKILPYSIDSGGGTSEGGGYALRGVIGQPDAGPALAGGGYEILGGVLASGEPGAGILFCDGFESGDLTLWSNASPFAGLAPKEARPALARKAVASGDG